MFLVTRICVSGFSCHFGCTLDHGYVFLAAGCSTQLTSSRCGLTRRVGDLGRVKETQGFGKNQLARG